MTKTVSTSQELGKAIKNGESRIVVTGKLGHAVISIEAIGSVAWTVAIGTIGTMLIIGSSTVVTGGATAPASAVAGIVATPALIASFGSASVATTAIGIAVAGGGIGTLKALRLYKAKREDGNVVLTLR